MAALLAGCKRTGPLIPFRKPLAFGSVLHVPLPRLTFLSTDTGPTTRRSRIGGQPPSIALLTWWGLALVLWFSGCRPATNDHPPDKQGTATSLRPITLQLNWRADAQHGGYYAARQIGAYREEGLEVTILEGSAGTPVIPKLVMGKIDFAVANADQILQAREQDADLVCVLAPLQHSPRCIMVHADAGIERLQDLANVTLAMNEGRTFAMFLKSRVPLSGVRIVPYSGTVAKFLLDPDYAQQAYVFSEPQLARREGGNPRCLLLSDLGFDPYTSSIAVRRQTLRDDPELVRRFVRASIRGWRDYLRAGDITAATNAEIQRLNPDMDGDALDAAVGTLRTLCDDPSVEPSAWGRMRAERWQTLAEQMRSIDAITGNPTNAAAAAWTDVFAK